MLRAGLCQAAAAHGVENRYSNLFPYDRERVVVRPSRPAGHDYINANWVNSDGSRWVYGKAML